MVNKLHTSINISTQLLYILYYLYVLIIYLSFIG